MEAWFNWAIAPDDDEGAGNTANLRLPTKDPTTDQPLPKIRLEAPDIHTALVL